MLSRSIDNWGLLLVALLLLNVADGLITYLLFGAGVFDEWNLIHRWALDHGLFLPIKFLPVVFLVCWVFFRTRGYRRKHLSRYHYFFLYALCLFYTLLVVYLVINGIFDVHFILIKH